MNARLVNVKILFGAALFTILVVFVAALELAVAVEFQFRDQITYFGLPWPMDSEFPDWVITLAMWCGVVLWLAMAWVGWEMAIKKASLNPGFIITVMAATFLAVVSIAEVIIGPFALAVWTNAVPWILLAIVSVSGLADDWDGYKIRRAANNVSDRTIRL